MFRHFTLILYAIDEAISMLGNVFCPDLDAKNTQDRSESSEQTRFQPLLSLGSWAMSSPLMMSPTRFAASDASLL